MRKNFSPTREDIGIENLVNNDSEKNAGLTYFHWKFFRGRGVNTANLARIFGKAWETIREWEKLDDKPKKRKKKAKDD